MGFWGWIAFDIFTLIASYLGVLIVSTQTIMRTMGLLTYMIPVGFGMSTAILLGGYIGEGKPTFVMHFYKISMQWALSVALFQNFILFVFQSQFIHWFTHNLEI